MERHNISGEYSLLSYFYGTCSSVRRERWTAKPKVTGSNPVVSFIVKRKYTKKVGEWMASRLSIEEERLKVGQVRIIKSDNGKKIDSITLLLNNNVEVLFVPKNDGTLDFTISDPNIDMSNLDCTISSDVLYDLLISIKNVYNQVVSNEWVENKTWN